MRRAALATIVTFACLAFVGTTRAADAPPPLVEREWQVDGVARRALLAIPPAAKDAPAPLVFAFHGHGGSMQQASRSMPYHVAWPEAVVVYMQGLPTPGQLTDPDGKRPGWQRRPGDQGDRDLKFFDAVLASLRADARVDPKRVYATGHSNGGSFTFILWATRGDTFAAVATSGSVPGPTFVADLKPKPALHLAGEADPLVKFAWQRAAMERLRKLNGGDAAGVQWAQAGPLTAVRYPSPGGTPFVAVTHPGGHQFPADAPALVVRFFKEQPKP